MDRRGFLRSSSAMALGLLSGCGPRRPVSPPPPSGSGARAPAFEHLEVSGTPFECGRAIGQRFEAHIRKGLERRQAWFAPLRAYMGADLPRRCDAFMDQARRHFPAIVEELEGWAAGSKVPLHDLIALNLKAELGAMMRTKQAECPGCSTLALDHAGKLLLAHNEDGDRAYADLMFLLTVRCGEQPAFTCLSYPGILPGNGPAANAAGLVLTTNYIASTTWRLGVPRYFLDRAVLSARSLDEAVGIACHPERAFAFHFNLASATEGRILSVETSLDRRAVHRVAGLYVHTNHLVLEATRDAPQDMDYVGSSSLSRYRVLTAWRDRAAAHLDSLDGAGLVEALASHQGAPYSPCRHPAGAVRGQTLATSLFDLTTRRWTLFPGNPCRALPTPVAWPT